MAVRAYLLVNAEAGKVEDVVKTLPGIEGVKSVDSVTGPYDAIAIVEADTYEALLGLVPAKIHGLSGIAKTLTCLAVEL